jgi:hypothetical protein
MQDITSVASLKNAIQVLEAEHTHKEQLMKEQFYLTYESLKPLNLLKKTLKDISSEPDLISDILGSATGLASGYLSKKIFVGASGNMFRKLIGAILQFGVTTVVSRHQDKIGSFVQVILRYFLRKKESILRNSEE